MGYLRYIGFGLLFVLICHFSSAQNDISAFERYKQKVNNDYGAKRSQYGQQFTRYRDRINAEYASYIERVWSNVSLSPSKACPVRPEPIPVVDDKPAATAIPLLFVEISLPPKAKVRPMPIEPIETDIAIPAEILPEIYKIIIPENSVLIKPDGSQKNVAYDRDNNEFVPFTYLGDSCKVRAPKVKNFAIPEGTNEEISKAWTALSIENFNDMLVDCLCLRESLSLCDWAFFQMTQSFTEAYWGSKACNEAILTQMYIMTQLGYKMRLAKRGGRLFAFAAFDEKLLEVPYISMTDGTFYCFDKAATEGDYQICEFTFPGEHAFSSIIKNFPKASADKSNVKSFKSTAFPAAFAKVSTNKYLLDFYETYPFCSWEIKAAASLSQGIKEQLYPPLKRAIAGVSEARAADILLNFIQTGFEYKTDEEQFGREKVFFGDEMFFYPFCDCEDRSILFSILVRDLLHLDVVLLDYPTHIATAVKFTEDVVGDFFDIDGSKYIVCDPTYIGASIGKSMPEMKECKAHVLKIQ